MHDEKDSLGKQAKKLEKYILTLPHAKHLNSLSSAPREVMITLQNSAYTARRSLEVYSSTDDTHEKQLSLEEAVTQLKKVQEAILHASQHDLLGIADVAHLSALSEQLTDQLK